jgi:hypothetical protein
MTEMNQLKDEEARSVNLGRHQAQCTICLHPCRQEIEEQWINWWYVNHISRDYGVTRDALYRHAHAFDLFSKRRRNIRAALEQIIERVNPTIMNGSVILSAIKEYVKMNSAEQRVEQVQGSNLKKSLERMSKEEREAFVRDGSLPNWFSSPKGATPSDSQAGEKESEVTDTKRLQ